jgi:periplasmic mercuric ion binding protein
MNIRIILSALFILFAPTLFAKSVTQIINVKGNCGSCKERIEEAAYAVKGVKKASWNKVTKQLTIVFNDDKITLQKIEIALATVGHDTDNTKASEAAYKNLPGCCAYRDRGCDVH